VIEIEGVSIYHVTSLDVVVTWSFKPTVEPLSGVTVTVRRAYDEVHASDSVVVASVVGTVGHVRDSSVTRFDRTRRPYYVVEAVGAENTATSEKITLRDTRTPEARAMMRRIGVDIRFGGVATFVFQKKRTGQMCSCVDEVLQVSMVRDCKGCYGTGISGGYYVPTLTLMKFGSPDKNNVPSPIGDKQPEVTQVTSLAYPVLMPNDLIFEVNTGMWWRVGTPVSPSEYKRTVLMLTAPIHAVNTDDVEYQQIKLPVVPGQSVVRPRRNAPITYVATDDNEEPVTVTVTADDDIAGIPQ
jgi:hypothetical protein